MCLSQYINKNSKIKLDNNFLVFELQSAQQNENFLSLKMSVQGDFSNYKNLTMENECFLEFDREFENRIVIQKEDSLKSYRLDVKHQEITI